MADPWAAFPDAPSADPWAAFPDAPAPRTPQPVGAAMSVNNTPMPAQSPTVEEPPAKPWSDLPGNVLSSAGNFVSSMVHPFLHPVDTVTGLADIGQGVVSKGRALARGAVGLPIDVDRPAVEASADAAGNYFADRFGSMRKIRNTLITDPVGSLADASMILAPGVTLPGRAGAAVGAVSRAIDPVTQSINALKLAGPVAAKLTGAALGGTSGAGGRSVADAVGAGKASVSGTQEGAEIGNAFRDNMRGAPTSDVVDRAKGALEQVRAERNQAYQAGKADLSKDATVLDFTPIDAAVNKAAEVGTFRGHTGSSVPKTVEPAAVETVDKMRKVVDDWRASDPVEFHTPLGIDALKRTLGNLRDSTGPHTPERVAANRIYEAVRGEIVQQAPAYSKMMEDYAKASTQLKETERTFSLGERATGDTAARKLVSATRNNVQTNFGERARLLDELAKYDPTLPYAIAGQAANTLAPRGIVSRGGLMALGSSMLANPLNVLAAPAFSPRLVGEGAYYAGKGAGIADRGANALRLTEENLRRTGRGAFQAGRQQEAR